MFGGDFQFIWVWKKNAQRYIWWPSKLSTFLARSQHWEVSCTPLSIISLYKNSSVLMFPGSSSSNISANLAKWHSSSTNELSRSFGYDITYQRVSWQLSVALLGIMLTFNQSSQTNEQVAYKIVGTVGAMNWSMKLASQADAWHTSS